MDLPLSHIWQPSIEGSQRLIIVLHGLGDSAEGFHWLQEELDIPSFNYLLLNAPYSYYTGYSWYDIDAPRAGVERSRKVLADVIAQTQREGYPADQTFLFGFSQGCLMTLEFGSRYSPALAGYVGISGYCLSPDAILREMNPAANNGAWLVTHGTEDELLDVAVTRAQMKTLNDAGFAIDYREYAKSHTIDPEQELPDIRTWLTSRQAQASSKKL
jgi:phospholipase/carboxylesterase